MRLPERAAAVRLSSATETAPLQLSYEPCGKLGNWR